MTRSMSSSEAIARTSAIAPPRSSGLFPEVTGEELLDVAHEGGQPHHAIRSFRLPMIGQFSSRAVSQPVAADLPLLW